MIDQPDGETDSGGGSDAADDPPSAIIHKNTQKRTETFPALALNRGVRKDETDPETSLTTEGRGFMGSLWRQ